MILAKVTKRIVATAKSDRLPARALLEVQPLEGFGNDSLVALDSVQAGPGDLVLVLQEGTGARQALCEDPNLPLPSQAVIVAIVDSYGA